MEQARPHPTGPKLIELLREVFELRGEDLIRRRSGHVIAPCEMVSVLHQRPGQKQLNVMYYRIKFALANGWLPPHVDHRDRHHENSVLGNLRAATPQQNACNRGPHHRSDPSLPRGVYKKGPARFSAQVTYKRKAMHLGSFHTAAEASIVVEEKLRELHGEFYRAPL